MYKALLLPLHTSTKLVCIGQLVNQKLLFFNRVGFISMLDAECVIFMSCILRHLLTTTTVFIVIAHVNRY